MAMNFEDEEIYGFEELFTAIGAESKQEKIRTTTEIYKRVEESKDYLDVTLESMLDNPENVEIAGNAVASLYTEFLEHVTVDSEFYSLDIEERLEKIETNPELAEHLN